jgi:serine/threonine protein kinase
VRREQDEGSRTANNDPGNSMKSDQNGAGNPTSGAPGERREPSFPKPQAKVSYVQTLSARDAAQSEPMVVRRPSAANPPRSMRRVTASGEDTTSAGGHGAQDQPDKSSGGQSSGGHSANGHSSGAQPSGRPGSPGAAAPSDTTNATSTTAASGGTDGTAGLPPIPELERMKGVGDTLNGRFVLEECIGFGGMGMVYKALDLRKLEASDRKPYIAIKVLNVQFRGHPKSLIALQREARKAQALAHPNIVAVYDFDRDGSMVYLTMEYLVGQPLSRILRAPDFTGMPFEEALPIITGMSNALAYAHQRGFVHCDLKPANVFLTERGDVKVIDFGIARVFQKTEEDMDATVFDAGSLGGLTPAYASPEMLEHRVPDPRDDIYALACISYELLTGRHPFDRMSASQARGTGMRPQRPKHLSYRQWRALKNALSFERETRTLTVTQFFEDIRDSRRVPVRIAAGVAAGVAALLLAFGANWYFGNRHAGGAGQSPSESSGEDQVRSDAGGAQREPVPFERPPALAPTPTPPQTVQPKPDASLPPIALTAVTPVLGRVPCSALTASVTEHTLNVGGFLSQDFGADRLKAQLVRLAGVQNVALNVKPIAQQSCRMLEVLAPYWLASRQSGATIRTRAAGGQLSEGKPLVVDVTTPNITTYVYVDYYVLDGGVAHLLPNVRARDNQAPPSYSATVGSFGDWIISKPFGTEMIVLVTTPDPLFKGLQPEIETASTYLRDLKKQLRQMRDKYGQERVAVDFVQINTGPKK